MARPAWDLIAFSLDRSSDYSVRRQSSGPLTASGKRASLVPRVNVRNVPESLARRKSFKSDRLEMSYGGQHVRIGGAVAVPAEKQDAARRQDRVRGCKCAIHILSFVHAPA